MEPRDKPALLTHDQRDQHDGIALSRENLWQLKESRSDTGTLGRSSCIQRVFDLQPAGAGQLGTFRWRAGSLASDQGSPMTERLEQRG